MDLRNVFTSTAIILVGVVAAMLWMTDLNTSYGTDAGSSFNGTMQSISNTLGNDLNTVATQAGENTQAEAGPAQTTQQAGLISRSVSTFQQVGAFFTIIPNLINDGAALLGLSAYAPMAIYAFVFALGISIALLFLALAGRFF